MRRRRTHPEAARLARVARYLQSNPSPRQPMMSQAECFRPAAEALDAVRAMGSARRSAFDPPKGALPRVAIERIASEATQSEREHWSLNAADDGPEPRVTHDSGWYCPIPGRPLPPIQAFEVRD